MASYFSYEDLWLELSVQTAKDPGYSSLANRKRKLEISAAPTKAKSQEPTYLQVLNQNKIDRQGVKSRKSGRQTVRRLWWMVFGVETGREVGRRG